ncbi:hypothetical protein BDV39DRAFT_178621 [Aspergillus sergii]|uniref:Transmembrane protein n=1 Tax=Aspergillus sergii TaxID=1034303 RepID=A0A5N6WXR2_9EURO|nr:hypothetical protein BDV39DRAFT_178621 [Aspergillus sergii]
MLGWVSGVVCGINSDVLGVQTYIHTWIPLVGTKEEGGRRLTVLYLSIVISVWRLCSFLWRFSTLRGTC